MSVLHGRSASLAIHEVRARARIVAERATHVFVVHERLPRLAREFEPPAGAGHVGALPDRTLHFRGRTEETVAYHTTLAALRFGSGYHATLAKRPGLSAGQSIVASLEERFRTRGPFAVEELLGATKESCAEWLGQPMADAPHMELMELYARSLRELGRELRDEHGDDPSRMVSAARGSAVRLAEQCARMPYFADAQRYRGLDVPFLARAQRLAIELAQAFELDGPGAFSDLDRLAPSADSVIPHVLRHDGALRYDRGLGERVDRGESIPAHSEREVEIRAAAVHVVELLVEELSRSGSAVSTLHVDTWLRARGRRPAYAERPRHRSRTVYY